MQYDLYRLLARILGSPTINPDVDRLVIDINNIKKLTELAIRNKMILVYYNRLKNKLNLNSELPQELTNLAKWYEKRNFLQKEELKNVIDASNKKGIDFMVIKTIKPFVYTPDDIDILLPRKNFKDFINLLKEKGYRLIKEGIPEVTMSKTVDGVIIDFDVHHMISASYIKYIDINRVWNNKIESKIDDYYVYIPSIEDDITISIGHSVLKELNMLYSDFYYAIYYLNKHKIESALDNIRNEGLDFAYMVYMITANVLHSIHFGVSYNFPTLLDKNYKLLESDISNKPVLPYAYPFKFIVDSYKYKIWSEVKKGNISILKQVVRFPFAKGGDIFYRYISNRKSMHV